MLIHTNICCRICQVELVISDKDNMNKDEGMIGSRRWKSKDRKCNKCRRIPSGRGVKTLYIQADGSKKPRRDPAMRYGLDADDITPDELSDERQVKELYGTYTDEMSGDLPYEEFRDRVVQDVIQGEKTGVQF